jgi:hypothetical protein
MLHYQIVSHLKARMSILEATSVGSWVSGDRSSRRTCAELCALLYHMYSFSRLKCLLKIDSKLGAVILATQPGQIVFETPCPKKKKKNHKNRAGGVAQGEGPEFKPEYHKKNRERERGRVSMRE